MDEILHDETSDVETSHWGVSLNWQINPYTRKTLPQYWDAPLGRVCKIVKKMKSFELYFEQKFANPDAQDAEGVSAQ